MVAAGRPQTRSAKIHDREHETVQANGQVATQAQTFTRWNLMLLGVSGGLVACPAAIASLPAA